MTLLQSIWKIPPDNQWDLLFAQLLDCNLQWICLAFKINQHRSIHTDLQRPRAQYSRPLVFSHIRRRSPLIIRHLFVDVYSAFAFSLALARGACRCCWIARLNYTGVVARQELVAALVGIEVVEGRLLIILVTNILRGFLGIVIGLIVLVAAWGVSRNILVTQSQGGKYCPHPSPTLSS